jgi:hypothetical protein
MPRSWSMATNRRSRMRVTKCVAGRVQPWTWQLAELFKLEKGKITRIDAFLSADGYLLREQQAEPRFPAESEAIW